MSEAGVWVRGGVGMALACASICADAQFVPPAGYSGTPGPGVATPSEPGAPALIRISDATLQPLFRVDPAYGRTSRARVKVVGAFAIAEPTGTRLVAAWSRGFLPVTLSFSDGRCFSLSADYEGGILSSGRLNRASCEGRRNSEDLPPPPSDRSLRLVGSAWGFGAWADDRADTTIVTEPFAKTYSPLFTARMTTTAIMAMVGPDYPGGNVTMVGRTNGRLTVVTLEVSY